MHNSPTLVTKVCLILLIAFWQHQASAQTPPTNDNAQSIDQGSAKKTSVDGLSLSEKFQADLDSHLLKAYEGDRDAQFKVGVLYTNDQYIKPDYEQAVYWYKQAANQNHILAQYNLGHQYLSGTGVEQSTKTAIEWWLKAANLDHPLAQFNIGRAYYLGIGLPTDLVNAKHWFERAAANNEPKSIEILQELDWNTLVPGDSAIAKKGDAPQTSPATTSQEPSKPLTDKTTALANETDKKTATDADKKNEQVTNSSIEIAKKEAPKKLDSNNTAINEAMTDYSNSKPTIVYNKPSIDSDIIATIVDATKFKIIKESKQWKQVQTANGFPVWVHGDFLSAKDDEQGVVTGNGVNARAKPLVTKGNIVGRLAKGDKVEIITKSNQWYRVQSPPRFKGWIKTNDNKEATASAAALATEKPAPKTVSPAKTASPAITENTKTKQTDDEWLFAQNADHYTLQLASLNNPTSASRFLEKSGLENNNNVRQFVTRKADKTWTYFLYSAYRDKNSAKQAIKDIQLKNDLWIRNIGKIQQNRCVTWKKQLPPPQELNTFCSPIN